MAETVFLVAIPAEPKVVRDAISTEEGIKSWWTDDARVPREVGQSIEVGFPDAPTRFALRIDETGDDRIVWTSTGDFPPHWQGTEVRWNISAAPEGEGTMLFFEHVGFPAADDFLGHTAFTWAQLMLSLQRFVESGKPKPFFVN